MIDVLGRIVADAGGSVTLQTKEVANR